MRNRPLVGTLIAAVTIGLCSCGGRGGAAGSGTRSAKMTVSVRWPAAGRLVPAASQSIKVVVSDASDTLATKVLARPADGSAASVTIGSLPSETVALRAVAYPNADGSGVAQAQGDASVTLVANQTASASLTMDSTVAKLTVAPVSVAVGGTATASVSATDASGAVVLLTVGTNAETLAWTTGAAGTATVAGTGPTTTVTGVAAGATTLTATLKTKDDGTTVSGSVSLTVTGGSGGTTGGTGYQVTDLGTLGGESCTALALNDAGVVVGSSTPPTGTHVSPAAFRWSKGHMENLGQFSYAGETGFTSSEAIGINDSGTTVGSLFLFPTWTAYVFPSAYSNPLTSNIPNAYEVKPRMIANDGDMVGCVAVYIGPSYGTTHAVLWRNGTEIDLTTQIGGYSGSATWVNESGTVLVAVGDGGGGTATCVWQDGQVKSRINDGVTCIGSCINKDNQIVGYHQAYFNTPQKAFKWANGVMTDIPQLGDKGSQAICINDAGLIGGWYLASDGKQHGFVYDSRGVRDLNDLNPIPGFTISEVVAINSSGQVLCQATSDTAIRSFLLTPSG